MVRKFHLNKATKKCKKEKKKEHCGQMLMREEIRKKKNPSTSQQILPKVSGSD